MNFDLISISVGLFEWILFSIGLRGVEKKVGCEKPWMAWIPGLRFTSLGKAIKMNLEGIFCGILDLMYIAVAVAMTAVSDGDAHVVVSLISLVVFVFLFIYRIRMFLQIIKVFRLKKRWIILFLVVSWLAVMIIGFGKVFQPQKETLHDEYWQAGTAPAQIPGAETARGFTLSNEGLSLDIKERTVKDGGKKRYLLKDICLNIPNKSLVLLLGGSGSGKTTLINAVIGYEKADATVLLNGSDVYKDYESVKYRIGYVPQKNLIRGKDTVIRTVSDAAKLRMPNNLSKEERSSKLTEIMDLLGLSAGQEGLVEKKSGGQLRRISIAMELVTDPELFVLDEPDSGLDGVIAREIFNKLRQVADEGRIVIVISHTPDRVIELFDKVIVLARDSNRVGRLAFYGSPAEAREFFGKDSMEGIVMSVNSKDEGGEGRADEFIEKYVNLTSVQEEGDQS